MKQRKAKGDATDVALLRFSAEHENVVEINANYTVQAEIPFNSKNKWMVKVIKPKNLYTHKLVYGEDTITPIKNDENNDEYAEDDEELILLKGLYHTIF